MAAAYTFHLCQNHPFVDGNKRVALASALVFLDLNGIRLTDPEGTLYPLMMAVARGEKGKSEIAQTFRELSELLPVPPPFTVVEMPRSPRTARG
jgi:death-on-curing protein